MIRLPNREGELDVLVKRCEMDITKKILKGFEARCNSNKDKVKGKNKYNEICDTLAVEASKKASL